MKTAEFQREHPRLRLMRDALVLVWVFIFSLAVVDTRLVYTAIEPVFYTHADFITAVLSRPGGVAALSAGLLGQALASRFLGALVLAAIAGAMMVVSGRVFSRFAGSGALFVRYIPVIIFSAMAGTYAFALESVISALIFLGLALVYMLSRNMPFAARAGVVGILTAILYFLAAAPVPKLMQYGHYTSRLHVLLMLLGWVSFCLGLEIRRGRGGGKSRLRCAALLPAFAAGPLALVFFFDLDMKVLSYFLMADFPFSWQILLVLAMYSLFLIMVPLSLSGEKLKRLFARALCKPCAGAGASAGAKFMPGNRRALSLVNTALVLVLLSAGSALPRWIPRRAGAFSPSGGSLSVCYFSKRGDYERVLDEALKLSPEEFNDLVVLNVNLALHRTGQLLDEMFYWPQFSTSLFPLYDFRVGLKDYRHIFIDKYLRLGRFNEAEHCAYEMMTDPPGPEVLWRLAFIHMVKDEPETARIYLRMLSGDLMYRGKALAYLDILEDDPRLSGVAEITVLRERELPESDLEQILVRRGKEFFPDRSAMYSNLLDHNPSNRMAADYLIGSFLLQGNVRGVIESIHRLRPAGYREMPRLVQEAVMVYKQQRVRPLFDMHGFEICPETEEDFWDFVQSAAPVMEMDPADASVQEFVDEYTGTFWLHLWLLGIEGGR